MAVEACARAPMFEGHCVMLERAAKRNMATDEATTCQDGKQVRGGGGIPSSARESSKRGSSSTPTSALEQPTEGQTKKTDTRSTPTWLPHATRAGPAHHVSSSSAEGGVTGGDISRWIGESQRTFADSLMHQAPSSSSIANSDASGSSTSRWATRSASSSPITSAAAKSCDDRMLDAVVASAGAAPAAATRPAQRREVAPSAPATARDELRFSQSTVPSSDEEEGKNAPGPCKATAPTRQHGASTRQTTVREISSSDVVTKSGSANARRVAGRAAAAVAAAGEASASSATGAPAARAKGRSMTRNGAIKGPWTKEEDAIIVALYNAGVKKWAEIAEQIPGRVGKQCRERWFNHLDPSVKKTVWLPEEDRILVTAQHSFGNSWTKIAKLLPGRSENAVKNRWNSAARRKAKAEADAVRGPSEDGRWLRAPPEDATAAVLAAAAALEEEEARQQHPQQQRRRGRGRPPAVTASRRKGGVRSVSPKELSSARSQPLAADDAGSAQPWGSLPPKLRSVSAPQLPPTHAVLLVPLAAPASKSLLHRERSERGSATTAKVHEREARCVIPAPMATVPSSLQYRHHSQPAGPALVKREPQDSAPAAAVPEGFTAVFRGFNNSSVIDMDDANIAVLNNSTMDLGLATSTCGGGSMASFLDSRGGGGGMGGGQNTPRFMPHAHSTHPVISGMMAPAAEPFFLSTSRSVNGFEGFGRPVSCAPVDSLVEGEADELPLGPAVVPPCLQDEKMLDEADGSAASAAHNKDSSAVDLLRVAARRHVMDIYDDAYALNLSAEFSALGAGELGSSVGMSATNNLLPATLNTSLDATAAHDRLDTFMCEAESGYFGTTRVPSEPH